MHLKPKLYKCGVSSYASKTKTINFEYLPVHLWGEPIELFFVPASAPRLV